MTITHSPPTLVAPPTFTGPKPKHASTREAEKQLGHSDDCRPGPARQEPILPPGARATIKLTLVAVVMIPVLSLAISAVVLDREQLLFGACVAFGMMSFIGLPFILAAAHEVTERLSAQHAASARVSDTSHKQPRGSGMRIG